jgi:chorismate mutase
MTTTTNLTTIRTQIDALDHQIVQLLAERMQLVSQVAAYKKAHNLPPLDAARWQQVLTQKQELAKQLGLSTELVTNIYEAIHDAALAQEAEEISS